MIKLYYTLTFSACTDLRIRSLRGLIDVLSTCVGDLYKKKRHKLIELECFCPFKIILIFNC